MRSLALLAILMAPAATLADAATGSRAVDVDAAARSIYRDYMSPYCPGLLLADCSSTASMNLRAEIRRDLDAGRSEAEVRSGIERTYGERVRATPPARGFGLVAWLLPPAFLLAGAGVVSAWTHRRRATVDRAPETPPVAPPPQLIARLERELRAES